MSKTYNVTINTSNHLEILEDDLNELDSILISKDKFHVLKNNKPFIAEIISSDFFAKKYSVKINNTIYEIDIASDLDVLIKSLGIEKGKTKLVNAIKAPMPGLILEINVEVGNVVKEGETLLILEAMKMENSFLSPRNGTIKSIAVQKGQAVDKGQLLIEFE